MGNDVDDVLALDMLYKYQDAGKIQLLLISNNKGNAYSAPFIHLMNDLLRLVRNSRSQLSRERLPRQKEKTASYVEAVAASGVFPAFFGGDHSIPWKNTGRSSRHNPTAAS